MTHNANFKRKVRARAAKTGESYTAARMHLRRDMPDDAGEAPRCIRVAVAQSPLCDDPRDIHALRAASEATRRLMRQAGDAGARLVHFPEGALCAPNKRIMSTDGPRRIGAADWSRCQWDVLVEELHAILDLARDIGLWVVFGCVHRLSAPLRPHNSLYVISDRGDLVTRYDERMLSNTKVSFLYTPGATPITFTVDGFRFGLALGMEVHYPEIFLEYERLDVDCVLFSTTGGATESDFAFAVEAQGHAATNSYWVSHAVLARPGLGAPSGIATPDGGWAARCSETGAESIAVAEVISQPNLARPWRRKARGGLYAPLLAEDDPRSRDRHLF